MSRKKPARGAKLLIGPVLTQLHAVPPAPQIRTDPYAPCPCGSGRQFKFCCFHRPRPVRNGIPPYFEKK